jgi:hypothetical protein
VAVATGAWHTCALTSGGALQCWGYNWDGQLGDGTTTHRSTPVGVSGLESGGVAVTGGICHTCALTSGGAVQCWGLNSRGILGDGTTTDRYTPALVRGFPNTAAAADVDFDGTSDGVVWRAGTGTWYARHSGTSGATYTAVQWGDQASGDVPVPGDYDGDGQTDLAVWRASTGVWYILKSSDNYRYATYLAVQWGSQADGDIPVPGDYDGDGKTDLAVWRPSAGVWYILKSAGNYSTYLAVQWGNQAEGDVPVPGDYDGDGKTDPAIWRASTGTWYWLRSRDAYSYATYGAVQWGIQAAGDTPMAVDYDGDGKIDPAVWRASTGTWYWLRSSNAYSYATYVGVQWGSQADGDVPMPGDYDGDGKTDPAVWRPSSGMWYAVKSSDAYSYGSYLSWQWGSQALGDVPVRPR